MSTDSKSLNVDCDCESRTPIPISWTTKKFRFQLISFANLGNSSSKSVMNFNKCLQATNIRSIQQRNRWNWWIWVANLSWTANLPATNIDDWLTLDDIDDGLVEEIWMIVEGWRRNFEDERTVIEFSIVTYLTLKVINIFTSLSPCLFMLRLNEWLRMIPPFSTFFIFSIEPTYIYLKKHLPCFVEF